MVQSLWIPLWWRITLAKFTTCNSPVLRGKNNPTLSCILGISLRERDMMWQIDFEMEVLKCGYPKSSKIRSCFFFKPWSWGSPILRNPWVLCFTERKDSSSTQPTPRISGTRPLKFAHKKLCIGIFYFPDNPPRKCLLRKYGNIWSPFLVLVEEWIVQYQFKLNS